MDIRGFHFKLDKSIGLVNSGSNHGMLKNLLVMEIDNKCVAKMCSAPPGTMCDILL